MDKFVGRRNWLRTVVGTLFGWTAALSGGTAGRVVNGAAAGLGSHAPFAGTIMFLPVVKRIVCTVPDTGHGLSDQEGSILLQYFRVKIIQGEFLIAKTRSKS